MRRRQPTEKYIMTAGMGTAFWSPGDKTVDVNNMVRGSCIYGIMPCNGLLYKPPDSCACYYMSKLDHSRRPNAGARPG